MESAKNSRYKTKVTVLDNLSTDSGLDYVRQNFPDAEIIKSAENKFLCSYNDYLEKVSEPVVILLNNDIKVQPGFLDPLVEPFTKDPQCFMVSPRCMSWDGSRFEAGRSKAGFKFGFFGCTNQFPGFEAEEKIAGPTAASGFGAFSREKFLELGGYDERFLPGIMEDADLCRRAAQKGWHLRYEPESVVHHIGQASFKKKFGVRGIQVIAWRNNFLFVWKNMTSLNHRLSHFFFAPLRITLNLIKGNTVILQGFLEALKVSKNIQEKTKHGS